MAVPKKKKGRAKTRSRRATHDKIQAPTTGWCSECGSPKLPHRVCGSCGSYRGRQLLRIVE